MPTRSTFPFQSGESMKHPHMLVPVVLLAAGLSAAQGGVGNLKQKITKVPVKNEQVRVSKGRPGDKVSINPQPLPPVSGGHAHKGSPGDKVSINPQPLPPKVGNNVRKGSPGEKVSLNPQPLPPKVGNNGNAIRSTKVSNVSKSKTQKVGQGVTGGLKNAGS